MKSKFLYAEGNNLKGFRCIFNNLNLGTLHFEGRQTSPLMINPDSRLWKLMQEAPDMSLSDEEAVKRLHEVLSSYGIGKEGIKYLPPEKLYLSNRIYLAGADEELTRDVFLANQNTLIVDDDLRMPSVTLKRVVQLIEDVSPKDLAELVNK
ncbi:hypothetical protein J4208_05450 [Candidatus Woesearchaeota archaeon]|nr:hypothetical protein [Candidatus Woesearchaeota archaeon]